MAYKKLNLAYLDDISPERLAHFETQADEANSYTDGKIAELGTAAYVDAGNGAGNVPTLNANGKLADSVIPALAINEAFPVASEAEQLTLVAEMGDIAIRSDLNKAFVLGGNGDPTVSGNWLELLTPTDAVLSVNGKTGAVTLAKGDVGLGNVTNESKATMFTAPTFTGGATVEGDLTVTGKVDGVDVSAVNIDADKDWVEKGIDNLGHFTMERYRVTHTGGAFVVEFVG